MLQQGHVALAPLTVPGWISLSFFGSKISNSNRGGFPCGQTTRCRNARRRSAFFDSQKDRTSGISAPQFGVAPRRFPCPHHFRSRGSVRSYSSGA
jgi:hypothetical protein